MGGPKMYKGFGSEKLTDTSWPKVGLNRKNSRKRSTIVGPKLSNVIQCFQSFRFGALGVMKTHISYKKLVRSV